MGEKVTAADYVRATQTAHRLGRQMAAFHASYDVLIWEYIAYGSSTATAAKLLRDIDNECFALGAWPKYGKARDDVREGLRSVSVSRHVVFYRAKREAIEIVRVLDERRVVEIIFSGRVCSRFGRPHAPVWGRP